MFAEGLDLQTSEVLKVFKEATELSGSGSEDLRSYVEHFYAPLT